ncbi:Molecular chaperone DnaK (HSP70) [Algoriphagus alkaliphilus]|uniref:Molecular chaperone DnaK (HSP70) n=1 Tax=Algoriphagus alkaliphilus TaxID=279824 RepID=A0A1G5ZKH2_9BACT|nr:Hsp70 family protein [Algoriphagus alkaliphilus]SDA95026.1 Molecular chaperone DnaK (HSP70) [Algoriphagus alkaliphilus]
MATDINIKSLFPALRNTQVARPATDIFNTSFIGIDFGTSTTVVSIATIDKGTKEISTKPIWLNQKLDDGAIMSSEKIPTVIAWYNNQLLVGKGAADLKYQLKKGVNVWYSFKMELGEDLGSKYYNSELDRNSSSPILNPKDAAKVFFQYLKAQIDRYIRTNNLPTNMQFAVSIPASFEANQRKELIFALEQNGISINKQSLIDEPNAAFLSYVQVSSSENNPLTLPEGDNPKVLVFDFGAGTCDVSILELGKDLNGIYSKNLSISKFEKLGGDDIDRLIAIDFLFPQLLKESGKSHEDFRTPEKNRIVTQLLKPAEQLKIMICENISLKMSNRILPNESISKDYVSVGNRVEIDTRKGLLTLSEPKLSYAEFNEAMKAFLKSTSLVPYRTKNVTDEFATIFSPIQTALKKASLSKDEIDYVLFIGGSSKNPYVQAALKEHFKESELLIPRDLQTHVSAGASIHSLIYNGFNKNIIQPITSEPFLVITKDETPKVILKAGTHIPCDLIVIDDLVTSQDGQQAIELPICLGNVNKLLYNIKIVSSSSSGFKRNTPVKLELEITTDKLLLARATSIGQSVMVEPINPFANKELTTEQRIVLKAERQANIEAEQNGGKPTKAGLEALYKAYEKVGNDLRAAETLELLNEIYPSIHNYNQIGVLFSSAGYDEKALEYYELAYQKDKDATTAFNYAYKLKSKDKAKFKEILEESLRLEPDKPHSLYELGKLLKREQDPKGKEMIQKAFESWKRKFESNRMSESDYSWLSSAADELGMRDFAQQVRDSKPKFNGEKLYNSENLTITSREEGIIKK